MKKNLLILLFVLVGHILAAQIKLGNNPQIINQSSLVELESSTKELFVPQMTTLQRNPIASPASGLLIFNTTNNRMEMNTGSTGLPNLTSMDVEHLTNISLLDHSFSAESATEQVTYKLKNFLTIGWQNDLPIVTPISCICNKTQQL